MFKQIIFDRKRMSEPETSTDLKSSQVNQIEEDEDELEGYNFIKTIGKGNFGKVRLGIHILTGEHVAIKILEKDLIFEKADIERISRQIKIMKLIRHPNLIQLYEIIEKPKRLYLIMEYADGGDLFDVIVKSEKLSEKKAAGLYAQIILGLEYLHLKGVTHRDMKPQNILISGEEIKIADFGLGNFFQTGEQLKTACGSPCYASPEMLSRVPYDPAMVDVWSSGIILYAMVCGYLPFEDQSTQKLYEKIKTTNPRYPRFLSQDLKKLLKRVLDKNPATRITTTDIKKDPWIAEEFFNRDTKQFEVDCEQIQKISKIYGIPDQKKLINYLNKNKHNNLTTIYYLAIKNKNDLDNIIDHEHESTEKVNSSHEEYEEAPERYAKIQSHQQEIDKKQVQTPHIEKQHSQSKIEEILPDQIQQQMKSNSSPLKIKPEQGEGNQSEASSQQKVNSLNNEISFSQLQTFSNQKEEEQPNHSTPTPQPTIEQRELNKEQESEAVEQKQYVKKIGKSSEKQQQARVPEQKKVEESNAQTKKVNERVKVENLKKNNEKTIIKKQDSEGSPTGKKNPYPKQKKEDLKTDRRKNPQEGLNKSQIKAAEERKPGLTKNRRMTIHQPKSKDKDREAPPLYERSHSKDKPLAHKKLIGKAITTEPFLIDPNRIVLVAWGVFSKILTELGAQGRIEYFKYEKTCLYVSKTNLRGMRCLKEIIKKINNGELN